MISLGFGLSAHVTRRRSGSAGIVYDFTSGALAAGTDLQRASAATYFGAASSILTAPIDTARFETDEVTGITGLLIEDAATNFVPYSSCSSVGWYTSGATLTNLSLNALGVFDGALITGQGADWHRVTRNASLTGGVSYVLSAYVRAGTSGRLVVQIKDNSTGSSSVLGGGIDALSTESTSIGAVSVLSNEVMGDGVTRYIQIAVTPDNSSSFNIGLGPDTTTAGDDVIILGCQIEQDRASRIIFTQGSTQSRAADQVFLSDISGVFDIEVLFTDGTVSHLSSVTVTSTDALPLPIGRIARLTCLPV